MIAMFDMAMAHFHRKQEKRKAYLRKKYFQNHNTLRNMQIKFVNP